MSSASPRRAPQRCRRARTPRRGISIDMAGVCAGRDDCRVGVVHRPGRGTGRHPIGCPQCPQARPQAVDNAARLPTVPGVRTGSDDGERGSTLPFVLVCWTVAALMAFGAIAASDAFLEQQEVQSVCDGAAIAAANRTDEAVVYATGVGTRAAAHAGPPRRPRSPTSSPTAARGSTPGRRRPTAPR